MSSKLTKQQIKRKQERFVCGVKCLVNIAIFSAETNKVCSLCWQQAKHSDQIPVNFRGNNDFGRALKP